MSYVYFISHPEVVIDRAVPVTDWRLSDKGLARLEKMLEQPWLKNITAVFSSNENKSIIAAERIGKHLQLDVQKIEGLGEMDRSATGMLEPAEFETVVNEAFANPEQSIRGWERLVDAQTRIVKAVDQAMAVSAGSGDIVIVSHGGVGTLLICKLKNIPITRTEDQQGQGHYFKFNVTTKELVHTWQKIDELVLP